MRTIGLDANNNNDDPFEQLLWDNPTVNALVVVGSIVVAAYQTGGLLAAIVIALIAYGAYLLYQRLPETLLPPARHDA